MSAGPTWCLKLADGIRPPDGRDAAYRFAEFDPAIHWREDGTFVPYWEQTHITRLVLPAPLAFAERSVSRVAVHAKVASYLSPALSEIHNAGLWHLLSPYGGGFVVRTIRGAAGLSMHSLGLALDFSPFENPLGATSGSFSTGPGQKVVGIFESWGFAWGGHFSGRKDLMHFQFCVGV